MNHLIFVYGTLKKGFGNHHFLANSICHGECRTTEKFKMLLPAFPVIMLDAHGYSVAGELYEVNAGTLERLDRLEGEGHMYHRRLITVLIHGVALAAEGYIGDEQYWSDDHYELAEPSNTEPPTLVYRSRFEMEEMGDPA